MDLSSHGGEMPMPLSSKYVAGHGGINVHNAAGNGPAEHHQFQPLSYSLPSKRPARYRECLKNHAAAIGGNATDGCGEFMPSGEDGSMEALKCSACGCHRNFHRKEPEGGEIRERDSFSAYEQQQPPYHPHLFKGRSKMVGHNGVLLSGDPFGGGYLPLPSHMVMPLGALQTSESEDMDGVLISRPPAFSSAKKRFRTKFTQEQKEKMLGFAEKAGWRLQKQEEGVVQQFCQEIGVKRRVLKVWMHNNKHNLFSRRNAGNGTAGVGGGGGSNCTSDGSNPIPIPMQTEHV